ncbi:hypothetical protein PBSP11RLL_000510200 [Plasmodium berghei]|uniref:Uncharacterized protein n=1 Tax=Plasmodium berghei TaxID=5821 RepID=A0A1D3L7C8_PLABE|nr:hypothetical protein PBSP11RLL_000510200 [Plasmodium berghei]
MYDPENIDQYILRYFYIWK